MSFVSEFLSGEMIDSYFHGIIIDSTCSSDTMDTTEATAVVDCHEESPPRHLEGGQEAAVDRLLAMRKTEASYALQSFLTYQQCGPIKLVPLSDTWRGKVTQWAFNVVDHFGFSREVVSVSMGIFDRYLATRGNLCTGNMVLLTSLTTLHLAIKLHETKRIKSGILADLSRGQFGTKHIDEMELDLLAALSWKLHLSLIHI